MTYTVKEIFYTLQGEGERSGRPAVFLRFSGCNLACSWCDTDFIGGKKYESAQVLAAAVALHWPGTGEPYVVCTGGEPLLQLDSCLVDALHGFGFEVAVETNGTIKIDSDVDWICVSPKAGAVLEQKNGNELKLVYPQDNAPPGKYGSMDFDSFYLQPMNATKENTDKTVGYCMDNPRWSLSLQQHKILGLP